MNTVYLVASGDLRLSANRACWVAQEAMERLVIEAVQREGCRVVRAHPYDAQKKHGFIDSQNAGMEVFRTIPNEAPIIVADAVWQYSHHVFPGLSAHRGPILTVANWSGESSGLVGLLNLNACLHKAGVEFSSLWSENFLDSAFLDGLRSWLTTGKVQHDTSHVRPLGQKKLPEPAAAVGVLVARTLRSQQAIMGVFDEGCMGMYNAIIPDELLHATGVFKERLSQSALYAKMRDVLEADARGVYDWLRARGMHFRFGPDPAADLTEDQIIEQCKMYIAAVRIAATFGCDAIGIQYQQGLKDLCAASDLAEGLMNNVDRPPVLDDDTGTELYAGKALPHFNEVDECAGIDALITNRIWKALGMPPETTLHDLRWGLPVKARDVDDFVWVLEISGAVPPAHLEGGYAGASSERQPPMYFPRGGGSIKGVCKPGHVVWSRVFVEGGKLNCDLGLGEAVRLPQAVVDELWAATTPQWPMMHLVLHDITRDQMMARHRANHIQVVYAPDVESAHRGLEAKAAAMRELGLEVFLCGAT